jgi:hypothetical protein
MNVGSPNRFAGELNAEGVGYAHSTVDGKDSTTLPEGRGIANNRVSNEY